MTEIHEGKYDYSKFSYINNTTKSTVICPTHGEFKVSFKEHAGRKHGCSKCYNERRGSSTRLSQDEAIRRMTEAHEGKYDYSRFIYKNSHSKSTVICPKHGEFQTTYSSHAGKMKSGCPKCGIDKVKEARSLTQDEAIAQMMVTHGDKYDYSKFIYTGSHNKGIIICKTHSEFKMAFHNHVSQKQGCPKCGYEANGDRSRLTTEEFIKRSREQHGDKYDYSKVAYKNSNTKVTIICPDHGEFQQAPGHHMSGVGCPQCYYDWAKTNSPVKLTTKQFVAKAKVIHGDKYDYSETVYHGNSEKVQVKCKEHGVFSQLANDHLSKKAGCQKCAGVARYTTPEFVELAKEVHQGKYTYEDVTYKTTEDKVSITCTKHGNFDQTPHDHLQGAGCPSCGGNGKSVAESELEDYIKSLGFATETRNRQIIKPYEIDVLVESEKIGFEYNGLYYHSDKFQRRADHKTKTDMAKAAGYRLIHIYEDDWLYKQPIVKQIIANALNKNSDKVYARNLTVVRKSHSDVKDFYESNHLQGSGRGDSWCLLDGSEIVAAMQFSQSSSERGNKDETRWELVRYTTSKRVVGGASRLFSAFLSDNHNVTTVISYSDNDLFDGSMYKKIGFRKDSDVKPDYKYVVGNKRIHKAAFKKSEIKRKYPEVYDENLTEFEMCRKLGYYRIYNSGLTKWVYSR